MGIRLVSEFHAGAIPLIRFPLADDATGYRNGDLCLISSGAAARVTGTYANIQTAGLGQLLLGIFHGFEPEGKVTNKVFSTAAVQTVGSGKDWPAGTQGLFIPIIPGAIYEADGAGTAAAVGDYFDYTTYSSTKGTVIQKTTTAADASGIVHEVVTTNLYRVKFANNVG